MIDNRRAGLLLIALVVGAVAAELPDTLRLVAFLLAAGMLLVFVFMSNRTRKRKHGE